MLTSDFDYDLPEELIAQSPAPVRDECKMLVLHKDTGELEHKIFKDILDFLNPGYSSSPDWSKKRHRWTL